MRRPFRCDGKDLLFDDPFLAAADDAYELYTHAGSDIDVHIPVVATGDVEGYLYPGSGMDRAERPGRHYRAVRLGQTGDCDDTLRIRRLLLFFEASRPATTMSS